MLSCIDLTIERQNKLILAGVSFSILPNSIHILKGANGVGKTSLLKAIAGLLDIKSEQILWNNKAIDYDAYYQYIIGYLGHENAIKANLSVIDNLKLWADLKDTHLLIYPALAHFKLIEVAETKCKHLSAGWQKRVALARMIVGNAKLWLLDEPEANLDESGRELLLKLLQVKISSGGLALIASHNLEYYSKIPTINLEDFQRI